MSTILLPTDRYKPQTTEYRYMQNSVQFQGLRSIFWLFATPMTVAGLMWYIVSALFTTFAPDLMATPVLGNINLDIVLGLLQFVTAFAVTWVYINFVSKKFEPMQAELREALESEEIAEIVAKREAQTC